LELNKPEDSKDESNQISNNSNDDNDSINFKFIKSLESLPEIESGKKCKYKLIVKTLYESEPNDRLFTLRLYGSENKSKKRQLNKSKTHDVPFLTGNLDEFHFKSPEIHNLIGLSFEWDEKENGKFSLFKSHF
jgi:hypothetical protein